MKQKPLLVLKIGTRALTNQHGELNKGVLQDIAQQVSELQKSHRIVLVSSGAVGCGKTQLPDFREKPAERKAAAAVGNSLLMSHYREAFAPLLVAQALCERHHFADRESFLQLWETFQALWRAGAVIIVNENDVVRNYHLRFSDNDELATMIACGFSAEKLLFGTSVDGVLHEGKVFPLVQTFQEPELNSVSKEVSDEGSGGMTSKVECAKRACQVGVEVMIFNAKVPGNILKAFDQAVGTFCAPQKRSLDARKKWMASGALVQGKVFLDEGAAKALRNRKSLLLVGVESLEGAFDKDDLVEIYQEHEGLLGMGKVKLSSSQAKKLMGQQGHELIHADEIALMEETKHVTTKPHD